MRGEMRPGRRVGATVAQAACTGRAQLKAGGPGTRGAHHKHAGHVCDTRRVEAHRLVERHRALPSQMQGTGHAYDAGRGVSREAGRRRWAEAAQAACRGWARLKARAERTWNMLIMSVTLDVSKLSGWLNATACCRVQGRVYEVQRGAGREAEGVGAVAAQAACTGRTRLKAEGPGHARSAHRTSGACP